MSRWTNSAGDVKMVASTDRRRTVICGRMHARSDKAGMIEAKELSKRFGPTRAVDSIDFSIRPGRVVGFLGPNGAGKTTTIRMITGLLPPTDGAVFVDGLNVQQHWRAVRQRIGYLPEAAPLYGEMRVNEYLRYRGRLFDMPRAAIRRAIEHVCDRCQLAPVRRRPIHQLSKGFRQRVGLAAAMLHDPAVLILDEPTVGLDPNQIRQIRSLIRELGESRTILFSTHILPEVEQTCDEIILIARGRIRAQGTIADVLRSESGIDEYRLEIPDSNASDLVRGIDGVESVRQEPLTGGWFRLTVSARPGAADLRESIARALMSHQIMLRELRRESATLEQLFVREVAQGEAEAAAREEAAA